MSITLRSAQTISNGVTMRGNNTQVIPPPGIVTSGLYANYDATAITNTSTFPDTSGNSRNATLFNSPATTTVSGTRVLQLDSNSSQYFGDNNGYGTDLDNAFTFDVWCCPTSAATAGTLIAEWGYGEIGTGGWQDTQMGFTNVDIRAGVYPLSPAVSKDSWTANTWYHIVTTYDYNGTQTKTYVNGVPGGTLSGAKASPGNTVLSIGIPCADYLGGVEGYFNGYIGAWKIYNRALTSEEVTQNFNALRNRYGA